MGFLEADRNVRDTDLGTEIVVTGTGVPSIDPARAGAGVLVRHDDVVLHFDAGRATAARVVEAGVDVADIDALFITHHHSDHVIGLHDFLIGRWVEDDLGVTPTLDIVAPNGPSTRYCRNTFALWADDLDVRASHNGRSADINVRLMGFDVPADPTADLVEVWSKGQVKVLAGPVRHEPVAKAVGYRVETPDGVIAISGDTRVCPEVAALAAGADVVVYEAMRTQLILDLAEELHFIADYHADTVDIGRQMAELEVPTLLLTHLLPTPRTPEAKQAFVDDVRSGGYGGSVTACDDLDGVTIVGDSRSGIERRTI